MLNMWSYTRIALLSLIMLFVPWSLTHAAVYGLKSAADSTDSVAPTVLFRVGETGGVSGVKSVKVGTANTDSDGLAISPTLGLYAFRLVSGGSRLIKIDPSTGAATQIGDLMSGRSIRGAVFDKDNRLLALDNGTDSLIVVNPTDATVIGTPLLLYQANGTRFNVGTTADIAQHADGTFYIQGGGNRIYTLNMITGVLTLQFLDNMAWGGTPYIGLAGAAFSADAADSNFLYVYDVNGSDDVFRYNLAVGESSRTRIASNIAGSFNSGRGD